MKKGIKIFIIILVMVFLFAIVISMFFPEKTGNENAGITVTGEYGRDYEYWNNYEGMELDILSDEITISGTAKGDITIVPQRKVSKLIFDNFKQDGYKVNVILDYCIDNDKIIIEYKGSNDLFTIGDTLTDKDIDLIAYDESSQLTLTSGVYTDSNLNIDNGVIYSGNIYAGKDINITGDTQIYLKPSPIFWDEEDDYLEVGIFAFNKLNIDLKRNGIIEIDNSFDPEYNTPVYGYKSITLGDNTAITYPDDVHIEREQGTEEDESEDLGYEVYNSKGNYPERIVIKYSND